MQNATIFSVMFGRYDFELLPSRFTVIVHYLPLPCKPQFISSDPFDAGRVASEGANIMHQSGVVLFERRDFCSKGFILRLHTVILQQPHLAQNKRFKKIENCQDACRNEYCFLSHSPNTAVSLHMVPFTHRTAFCLSRCLPEMGRPEKCISRLFPKNKTTKTFFVVEIQHLMYGFVSIISHYYFFLVVFLAFFAGAFFVAMCFSPPFIMG